MKRRFFSILAGLSLLLAVATAGVWTVSYWRVLAITYSEPSDGSGLHQYYALGSVCGAMYLNRGPLIPRPNPGGWRFEIDNGDFSLIPWLWGLWFRHRTYGYAGRTELLCIPLWFPTLQFLILPLIWFRRHRRERHRQRAGLCRTYGYDLRAHAPRQKCPECGAVIPADLERKELT